jgi:hypothetical protein
MAVPSVPGTILVTNLVGNELVSIADVSPVSTVTTTQAIANLVANDAVGSTVGAVSTALFTATTTTVLASVPGMTVTLQPGTYMVDVYLSTSAPVASGLKVSLGSGSTATASLFLADSFVFSTTTSEAQANSTVFAGNQIAATVAATVATIQGTLIVSAAGTVVLQAAQNVSGATPTTIAIGSYMTFSRIA